MLPLLHRLCYAADMTKRRWCGMRSIFQWKTRATLVLGLHILAAAPLYAAEPAPTPAKKSVAENALYESMVCRELAVKDGKKEDAKLWTRLNEELAKLVPPPEQQRARTLADGALFDMSKAELKQEKAFCAQILQQRRKKESQPKAPPEPAKESNDTKEKPARPLAALQAERARCLVIMQVLQHHARATPTLIAPKDQPERQQAEQAAIDKLVLLWRNAFVALFAADQRTTAKESFLREEERFNGEWNKRRKEGDQRSMAVFLLDQATICKDKMGELVKSLKGASSQPKQ